jgi:hypothetical protein
MTYYSGRRVLAYAGAAVVTITAGGLEWTRAIAQSATSASNGATDADSMGPPASPAFASLAKAPTAAQDANPLLIQRVYQELSGHYADLDTVAPPADLTNCRTHQRSVFAERYAPARGLHANTARHLFRRCRTGQNAEMHRV